MELSEPAIVTPNDELIAAHSGNAGAAVDPFFTNVKSELYDKGFLVATADNLIAWARTGLRDDLLRLVSLPWHCCPS